MGCLREKEKEVTRQREDKLPKKLLLCEEKEEAVVWEGIEQAGLAWGTWERREQRGASWVRYPCY